MLEPPGVVPADGLKLVRRLEGVGHLADRQSDRRQPRRVRDHFDLARVARQHLDVADTRDAGDGRTDDEKRVVVEVGRLQAARQVHAEEWEGGRGQPFDDDLEIRRQRTADLGDAALRLLQRHDHIGRRLELARDLRRAAEGLRAYAADAGHFHERLFEGPRDAEHHRARGGRPAVPDDDHAPRLRGSP